jgi:putative ABC transport system permease protein
MMRIWGRVSTTTEDPASRLADGEEEETETSGMGLAGVIYIYRARLKAKAVLMQEGFAIIGIAVGVALLFASQVSSASLTAAVTQLNNQLVGSAQLELKARGPEGTQERLLAEVRKIPGVQVALPLLERQVNVVAPGGTRSVDLIGVEPEAVRASGPLLKRFSARQLAKQPAIALPAPLAGAIDTGPLESIRLQIGARYVETLVGATLQEADIGGLVHSPVAVTSINYAQKLLDANHQLTRVFVRYAPRRSTEVRASLARLAARWHVDLDPAKFEAQLFQGAVGPESQSEQLFSGISALVGFLFALCAMLITVPTRRKLIADLRPDGWSRWMTVQVLLFDALVIGGLACVVGLGLGELLSIVVFHTTPGYLTLAFPIGSQRVVTLQSIGLAVAAGMLAAIVGVLWPVSTIVSTPLQPAVRVKDHRRARLAARVLAGLVFLGITTFTLIAATRAAIIGNIALVAALVCLLSFLFDGCIAVFGLFANASNSVAAALAAKELRADHTRVRSIAIALVAAVAVFGVVEFQGTQTNLRRGLETSIRGMDSNADLWVVPKGSASLQTTVPFHAADAGALARLRGVRQVVPYHGSFLDWGSRRVWVIAPGSAVAHPIPDAELLSANATLATARVRQGGWAVLSKALVSEYHLHIGETFTLPAPRPQVLRLAGVVTNLGWPPGAVILSGETYARSWTSSEPSAYEIQTAPHLEDRVQLEAQHVLAGTGLVVQTASEREELHFQAAAQGLSRLTQIRVLVLLAAILALALTMGAMVWQRRDQVSALKCEGFDERVLRRWLLYESAVLFGSGALIGAVAGLYAQLLGSHFLSTVTGFPIIYNIEGVAAVTSFALVTALTVAMVAIPGYLVVRVPAKTVIPVY